MAIPVAVSDVGIEDHVIDEGIEIEILLDGGVASGTCDVSVGDIHHLVEGREVAIGSDGRIYRVVVVITSAKVICHVIGIRPFVKVVEAPVDSIKEEVGPAAMGTILTHLEEKVAGPLVASIEGVIALIPVTVHPAKVVFRAELESIEFPDGGFSHGGVFEKRIAQFSGTVSRAKAERERVLGRVRAAGRASLDADSGIDLETRFRAVGEDELSRGWPLPSDSFSGGVLVNAGGRIEKRTD